MTASENTDDLIAAAKAEADARYDPQDGICQDAKLGFVEGAQWAAALDAVQPVLAVGDYSPDRETLEAILDQALPVVQPRVQRAPNMRGDDGDVDFQNDRREGADIFLDVLLASGVLGQPQPQPDRTPKFGTPEAHDLIEKFVDALEPAVATRTLAYNLWNLLASDDGPLRDALEWSWGRRADALLPLLGQPRTDAPLDPEPWVTEPFGFRQAKGYDAPGWSFKPQEGFEQDQARYPRTDTTEPGDES